MRDAQPPSLAADAGRRHGCRCRRLGVASGGRANAYYSGPASDHFDGVRFFNPNGVRPKGPGAFLKWQFGERGEAWPKSFPSPFPADRPPARFDGEGLRVTYVGHAAFLIQTRGKNVLVDPVWSERVSPVSFAGPRRVNEPGIAFDHLPAIDVWHRTHNHYDHGHRYDCLAVAALPPAHCRPARQRRHPGARRA
jgi:hypothetical protein